MAGTTGLDTAAKAGYESNYSRGEATEFNWWLGQTITRSKSLQAEIATIRAWLVEENADYTAVHANTRESVGLMTANVSNSHALADYKPTPIPQRSFYRAPSVYWENESYRDAADLDDSNLWHGFVTRMESSKPEHVHRSIHTAPSPAPTGLHGTPVAVPERHTVDARDITNAYDAMSKQQAAQRIVDGAQRQLEQQRQEEMYKLITEEELEIRRKALIAAKRAATIEANKA